MDPGCAFRAFANGSACSATAKAVYPYSSTSLSCFSLSCPVSRLPVLLVCPRRSSNSPSLPSVHMVWFLCSVAVGRSQGRPPSAKHHRRPTWPSCKLRTPLVAGRFEFANIRQTRPTEANNVQHREPRNRPPQVPLPACWFGWSGTKVIGVALRWCQVSSVGRTGQSSGYT